MAPQKWRGIMTEMENPASRVFSREQETMKSKRDPDAADPIAGEIAILLQALDEGYERKAWHGPNLKGSIRGISAENNTPKRMGPNATP